MKKNIVSLLCFIAAAFGFTSCDGLEMSQNGKLEGYWHIVEIDTLATGGVRDMSKSTLFLGVQMQLMSFYDSSSTIANLFSHFEKGESTLRIYDFYRDDRLAGDHQETNIQATRQYGINNLNETFVIEHLSSKRMELRSNTLKIKFIKL